MYREILYNYWGYNDFRGIQREIIESIAQGRDTLGLMPTGGGKSITFQVPALAQEGVCIVITPLIALMKDQVSHLRRRGIMATAIYAGMLRDEVIATLENCILGDIKLLYVSPERLTSPLFRTKLAHMKVSFITVDEAHCISQWGYDFRPAYLDIVEIRKLKPEAPILALTASATPKVVEDIQDKLQFKQRNVHHMSFERKNLAYVLRETLDKEAELLHILKIMTGSAIVYTRSRKGAKELSKFLSDNGINSTFYHAGLHHAVKDQQQRFWQEDKIRVMVATNAFGMGIDKPDVRLVVHIDCPDSLEAYFQEAGRAGRDGQKAWAVLLYNASDKHSLHRRTQSTYPKLSYIKDVYEHLAYFFQIALGFGAGQTHSFDIDKFCRAYRMFPTLVDSSLRILQNAGYIEYETDPDSRARLIILLQRSELYKLKELSPNEEAVMTAALRLYGGLFVDYVYISEAQIAITSGVEQSMVYLILRSLSKQHIVHFIPQRKTPFITYLRDREAPNHIIIPRAVYDDRKKQMEKKTKALIEYAENYKVCRSKQLLAYFGEKQDHDCGHCDVCIAKKRSANKKKHGENQPDIAEQAILDLLGDGKEHHITELRNILLPTPRIEEALEHLIEEHIVRLKYGEISIAKRK